MNLKKMWNIGRLILCRDGYARAEYIKKKGLFGAMGEHCYFHPWWMPGDPKYIFMGNNVKVASDVMFINHDIANGMLKCLDGQQKYQYFLEPIRIGDNVLIGSGTIILPGKRIGSNVVIGAGTVVSKDIPDYVVVAGNPVRIIGTFEDFQRKRSEYSRV